MRHAGRARWECHACHKVAFGSESRAMETLGRIEEESTRDRIPVRAYECEYGNGWHLTSTDDWAYA